MNKKLSKLRQKGFTLVELLIVMAILGILVTLIAGGFRSAQLRGRDAQRKSDLKELSNALELFYADYGTYPPESSGYIAACPYDPVLKTGTSCNWGQAEFTDGKTTYFKILPKDPSDTIRYSYRVVPLSSNQKYRVFARLENTRDGDCLNGNCEAPPAYAPYCGTLKCNYAVTSPNTTPAGL